MADVSTVASLATAGGTLILAVATFSSTRSANRAARVSEQALRAGLRPVLFNARAGDPPQKVGFVDSHWVHLRDGLAAAQAPEQVAAREPGGGKLTPLCDAPGEYVKVRS